MHRPIITLLSSAIACLALASVLWGGTDMTGTNSGKGFDSSSAGLKVLWTVLDYKRTDNATWTENEAKGMLFKPLYIDKTSITFGSDKCENIYFKIKEVKASEYLERIYKVDPQWLGITDDPVKLIQTNCDIPGFSEYIRLKDRRLVIFLNGIFFFLELNVVY